MEIREGNILRLLDLVITTRLTGCYDFISERGNNDDI